MVCILFHHEESDYKNPSNETAVVDSFSSLTRVCFFLVCEHLPLSDLLTSCARVNRHWRAEVTTFCRTRIDSLELITNHRSSPHGEHEMSAVAHLLTKEDGSRLYPSAGRQERFSLECYNDDPSAVNLPAAMPTDTKGCGRFDLSLARTLTSIYINPANIRTLVFHHRTLTDVKLEGLCHLLSQWRQSLTTFRLSITQLRLSSEYNRLLAQLFKHINSLCRLECLTLHFMDFLDPLELKPNLRVLSWLREFSFACPDKEDLLYSSLIKYAEKNANLSKIIYQTGRWERVEDTEAALNRYLTVATRNRQNHAQVIRRFTQLPFSVYRRGIILERLPTPLGQHLPSLTTLNLEIIFASWTQTMRSLSELPQLRHLEILARQATPNDVLLPVDGELNRAPRLPSVCTLNLHTYYSDHRQLAHYSLPHYFPRLQVYRVLFVGNIGLLSCSRCLEILRRDPEPMGDLRRRRPTRRQAPWYEQEAAFKKCSQELFEPWRETLKYGKINLHKIVTKLN